MRDVKRDKFEKGGVQPSWEDWRELGEVVGKCRGDFEWKRKTTKTSVGQRG